MVAVSPSAHRTAPHRFRQTCWLVAVAFASFPAVFVSAAEPPSVPFRLASSDRFIIVNVDVGDEMEVPFLLDTASSATVIDEKLAERLTLDCPKSRQTVTQTGRRPLPAGTLKSLTLGSITVRNLPVLVSRLTGVVGLSEPVGGVLGQDVLEHANYLIDYTNRLLTLDTDLVLSERLRGDWLQFTTDNRRMIVRARVPGAAVPLVLALDSAASSLVLFDHPELDVELTGRLEQVRILSMVGERPALRGQLGELRLGTLSLRRVGTTLTAFPKGWTHVEQDGLLPTFLFDAVYVDNLTRLVMFNPKLPGTSQIPKPDTR